MLFIHLCTYVQRRNFRLIFSGFQFLMVKAAVADECSDLFKIILAALC